MHENAVQRVSYPAHKRQRQSVSIAYRAGSFCRKYSTLPYTSSYKGRSTSAAPAERAISLTGIQRARLPAGRAPKYTMTEHATDEEYSSPTKETTVSADIHEPEPEHFADVQLTLSGRMQFVDPDDTDRWITTDTVAEVTR